MVNEDLRIALVFECQSPPQPFPEQTVPTIEQNLSEWNASSRWREQGDEWSVTWGGVEPQWYGALYPRIRGFLPAPVILEIAPGFGRWTQFLKGYCDKLILVDLAENCIETCKKRFASSSHILYYTNDGKSLAMIEDRSLDFVFSFDSLVHAEAEVMKAYIDELSRKLTVNGVGFMHHSNVGEYRRPFSLIKKLPDRVRASLNLLSLDHWRAYSMTAPLFEQYCRNAGMQCISQEMVNWGSPFLIDCFSVFTPTSSRWARTNRVSRNYHFMKEANFIRELATLYSLRDH